MKDVVYAVYYQGVHQKSYLIITTNEEKAKEVAGRAQGFLVEKWKDGKIVNQRYYHGGEE